MSPTPGRRRRPWSRRVAVLAPGLAFGLSGGVLAQVPASQPAPGPAAEHADDAARDADVFGAPEAPAAPAADPDAARDAQMFGGSTDGAARDADVLGATDEQTRDAEMFDGQGESAEPTVAPPTGMSAAAARDQRLLGDPGGGIELADDVAPADPLTIGGLMYLRAQGFALQEQPARDYRLTVPTLAQLYFDVRPNDRVRGYIQARLQYDPTLPASASQSLGVSGPLAPGASSNGVQSLGSAFATRTRDPRFVLDQLWINFDVAYRAFVTVGKVHDRWGTARFWMPTDYLHLQNRNPIDVFDSRAGTSLIKLHVPVESLAWNFYAYAVLESPGEATPNLSRVAGAVRGEFVVETIELGLGLFARRDQSPRGAADLSFGVWDLDFYGELALRDAGEVDRVRFDPDAPLPTPSAPPSYQDPATVARTQLSGVVDALFPVYQHEGLATQAVGGVTYSISYDDDDVLTLGAEYFYNGLGYGSSDAYLGLLLPHGAPLSNPATFFYLGRHYLAVFATLPAPFQLDLHSFTLSTLGNLSDGSYISRFDYAYTLLTHLRFEAFVAVHYGRRSGEFRFGIDDLRFGQASFSQPPSLLDLGLALRLQY